MFKILKKVIIIGATSGIGKELAEWYLVNNCTVGITGRRQHLLDTLKDKYSDKVITAAFDVMGEDNLHHVQSLIDGLGGLDILIYNSGYGEPFEALNYETENVTTKTNVNGFLEIVNFAFNYFLQQGSGQIAVTSSIAALRGNSWTPAYSASKAYMSNYAEGLNIKAHKLKKDIIITDIKPGFIDTKMAKGTKRFWVAPPQKAAKQIYKAIKRRKRKVYITRRWWLIAQLMKIIPYSMYKRF